MTTSQQQAVPVAQEDREFYKLWSQIEGRKWSDDEVDSGELDGMPIMSAIARHRLSLPCKSGEGARLWTFNEETREIECGNAPVFRVYSADDFPCIEDEDRAKQAKYFDAQAQTVVLMLNSLLHDSGDTTPVPDPDATQTREAETWASIAQWCEDTFGPVTMARTAERANEEMQELLADPENVIEAADVCIVLSRYPGLWDAVERKMAINRARTWDVRGDGTGYHVKPLDARGGA